MNPLICIIGTTATGKTKLAVALAAQIDGEILSADSRQVYKGMDLGTGKDLQDFVLEDRAIPYHLIDIAAPGEEYNLFRYKRDFYAAYEQIKNDRKMPVLVGGSGMYVDAIVNDYQLGKVPQNQKLRKKLEKLSMEALIAYLKSIRQLHNTTDVTERDRCIRAIEIEEYHKIHGEKEPAKSKFQSLIFGVRFERSIIRQRITNRLSNRIESGMIEEVKNLLESGVSADKLKFYGLEYKFLTAYVLGEISKEEMFNGLNTAIHQFAKRQETWWRRMEKRGTEIHWIDGNLPLDEKLFILKRKLKSANFIK